MKFVGAVQYNISQRRCLDVPRPAVVTGAPMASGPLPSRITIDVAHHHPKSLPATDNWERMQCNGRVWIADHNNRVVKMDAAQYGLLLT
jgi:hypothetical protein